MFRDARVLVSCKSIISFIIENIIYSIRKLVNNYFKYFSMDLKHFGILVKAKRIKLGWSLDQLASHAGIKKSYLSRIENKGIAPSREVVSKITDALKFRNVVPYFTYDEDTNDDFKKTTSPNLIRRMHGIRLLQRGIPLSPRNNLAFMLISRYIRVQIRNTSHLEDHRKFLIDLLLQTTPEKIKDDEALKKYNDMLNRLIKINKDADELIRKAHKDQAALTEEIYPPLNRYEGDLTEEEVAKALKEK